MPLIIRDRHLEDLVRSVQIARCDGTITKTAVDLLREKLTEMGVVATSQNAVGGDLACGANGEQANGSGSSDG